MSALEDTIVVILAGGASSRMGQNKADLELPTGQKLLEYMISKFSNYNVFISGAYNLQNITSIKDVFDIRHGPVAGFISSLLWVIHNTPQIKQCVFVPVDMAYLENIDIKELISAKSEIAFFKDSYLPLKIRLSNSTKAICNQILKQIKQGTSYSVSKFIDQFESITKLSTIKSKNLTNINYLEDWNKFKNECMS